MLKKYACLKTVNRMALPFSPAYNEETTDHYPFSPRKFYSEDFSRNFPMYRAKIADFASVLINLSLSTIES